MNINELFIEVDKLPKPLSKKDIFKLFEERSIESKEKIIKHNIRLVISQVMTKFGNVEYDKRDLVSIGNIGLIKAVNTFDTSKNIEFATYATKCINNEILMFLRKIKKESIVDSIHKPIVIDPSGNELKIEDIISDNTNLTEEYVTNETYNIIKEIIYSLNEKERNIIIMYFGFFDTKRHNQKEIAQILNISQSYISRIIKRTLIKIKTKLIELDVIEEKEIKIKRKQPPA